MDMAHARCEVLSSRSTSIAVLTEFNEYNDSNSGRPFGKIILADEALKFTIDVIQAFSFAGVSEMSHDNPKVVFDAGPADSGLVTQPINKLTWAMAGRVTDPCRYMFRLG
jgi:hypothetical protein